MRTQQAELTRAIEWQDHPLFEAPAYSMAAAARYVGIRYHTMHYWAVGRPGTPPIIRLPQGERLALSFLNLLECHILDALRMKYGLEMRTVRPALKTLKRLHQSRHPLLDAALSTDGLDLFLSSDLEIDDNNEIDDRGPLVNLSQGGQIGIKRILKTYIHRIRWSFGVLKFYPFVGEAGDNAPRIVSITPAIAFGRSVIDGTGISTAVIAARFLARDSVPTLAKEYGRATEEIEEAIRWETSHTSAPP